jgi:hypothetical protein
MSGLSRGLIAFDYMLSIWELCVLGSFFSIIEPASNIAF